MENNNLYILKITKSIAIYILITMFMFVLFCNFDMSLRKSVVSSLNFYPLDSVTPNLMTYSYIFVLLGLVLFCPKKISKIVLVISFLLSFTIFIVNYMLFHVKGTIFSVSDLNNVSEGFAYLNFLTEYISKSFITFLVSSILIFLFLFILITFRRNAVDKRIAIIFTFLCFITSGRLCFLAINNLESYSESDWNKIQFPKYYYDNFIDSNKSFQVLGLYGYQIRDIFLYLKNRFISYGSSSEIEELVNSFDVNYEKNEMTGVFSGKNLILIQLESIDKLMINKETMPTLYYMKENGWDFTGRYSNNLSTLATEFAISTGLYLNENNYYNVNNNTYTTSMPSMFGKNGYRTASIHENFGYYYNRENLHKNIGFQNSYFLLDLYDNIPYATDSVMVEVDEIYNSVISKDFEPFMSLFITVSGHGPYNNSGICLSNGIENGRKCLEYLSNMTDQMLKLLLKRLDEDNLLDNTVILLYSDHYPYSYNYSDDDLSNYKKITDDYSIRDLPFIIYSTDIKHREIDTYFSDVDVLPTILNMYGISYDVKKYVGVDIFSENHKNLCYFLDYNWYNGMIYNMNLSDGVDLEYIKEISSYVERKIKLNNMILSNNYYN